jgi:hypothetical protein
VAVSGSTAYRTKRCFVEGNLERALSETPARCGTQTHGQGEGLADDLLVAAAAPVRRGACWTLEFG